LGALHLVGGPQGIDRSALQRPLQSGHLLQWLLGPGDRHSFVFLKSAHIDSGRIGRKVVRSTGDDGRFFMGGPSSPAVE
jgi:hypothetical protein